MAESGVGLPFVPAPAPEPPVGVPPEGGEELPPIIDGATPAPSPPTLPGPAPGPTAPLRPSPPPETPDTGSLPGFDKLALLIVILGLVLLAKAFTDFMNWLFRTMLGPLWPRTGSKTLTPTPMTKALGSYLGTFGQGFDSELGVN